MKDKLIKTGWHWQFGWLRRPEEDNTLGYCYEEPDGDLVYTPHACHEEAVTLYQWKDRKTGEMYLTLSRKPSLKMRPRNVNDTAKPHNPFDDT